ncbi:hypothetical protein SAMN04515647_3717 [Cohaesibacter sp. ES.047]|uniref:hypothetical protein n=1 Tax=Cohaesibacter sp. ES.047 TaxID=1798205 RepID=UPI000BB8F255|nr:hypothetical protein [Cohaesibacter sp. ES.047]SNY93422.1 hypothetical protein SAMN04515647_3717 [Cohaesibacter sp. ES.047]
MSTDHFITKKAANRMLGQPVIPGTTKVVLVEVASKKPRVAKDPIEMTTKQMEPFLRTGQVTNASREASRKKFAAKMKKEAVAESSEASVQPDGSTNGGD